MNILGFTENEISSLFKYIKDNYPSVISTRDEKNTVINCLKIRVLESFEEIKYGGRYNPGMFNETLKNLRAMVPGIWKSLVLPFVQIPSKINDLSFERPILALRLQLGK